jgi:hypothetical protein
MKAMQVLMMQRCPSRLKICRCRAATFQEKSYRAAAAPRWFLKKRCRAAAAMVFKKIFRI